MFSTLCAASVCRGLQVTWHEGGLVETGKGNEGPKRRLERGVNESRLKISRSERIGLVPRCTPNPGVQGKAWSSYGGATPTQESPRNKREQPRKQPQRNSAKLARYMNTG